MAVTADDLRAQQEAAHADTTGFKGMLHSAQRLVHSYAFLAVLDMRRATVQLAWLIACGVIIAVLLITAWFGLLSAFVGWLLGQHFAWPAILLFAAGLNVLLAAIIGWRIKELLTEMPFAATLRQLKGDSPEKP